MENAESILVIILSVTLTVFLVAAIVLIVTLVRLARTLKEVAHKAEGLVDNVESAATVLKKAAGPLAAGKFALNLFEIVTKRRKG